ncbi:MAG TPA: sigma-54 dependent transcriptional regulator [Kofleriaceae bacterium]
MAEAEADVRERTRGYLHKRGFAVDEATTLDDAANLVRSAAPDLVIIDNDLAARDHDLVGVLRRADERVPIILLVDHESPELGTRAMRQGADHYVLKPVDLDALLVIVQRVVETQRTRRRSVAINVLEDRHGLDPFVGTSPVIQELSRQAHRVLDSHAPILIQGETGTGKGVLARWLHHHGPRAEEALVDINCAGLSREFVESELFGHERGAFTGASASKLGLLDVAHRGTAFLDEIGEIDLQLQPRLLKVLEEKRFRRLGDVRDHSVDVRLIAATNRDLAKRSREGTFRADLYFRINTLALTVPSLRERVEDIPQLAKRIANTLGHDIDFTHEAIRAMQAYTWPGNVRELRNVIERAILISNHAARITPKDLRFEVDAAPPMTNGTELGTLVEAERRHIERVLRHENGSVERAATHLGISRSTLYQKLRRFGIATKG